MKSLLHVGLGIVASMGGFVEVGSISTSAQAGAAFGFRLVWAGVLAACVLAFLIEMTGRLAAVSQHTFVAAVRERFGFAAHAGLLGLELLLDSLLLAAEIGGVSIALHLATGIAFRWWVVPVAFGTWLLLWRGTFGTIEHGISLCGLVTLAFVAGAVVLGAQPREVASGLVPTVPTDHLANYGFQAVAILGATVSPYLLNFYSSGAIEDGWKAKDLRSNRIVAWVGSAFGVVVSLGILVVAGLVLAPAGIRVESYEQAAPLLVPAFGGWGFGLFVASLAIGCFGAALEVTLNLGYLVAQTFGWNWGEDSAPQKNARFAAIYSVLLVPPVLLMLTGIDPLRLTLLTMALTVIVLPIVVFPLLVVMNDPHYLKEHVNGRLANWVVVAIVLAGATMAVVVVPLEIAGGS